MYVWQGPTGPDAPSGGHMSRSLDDRYNAGEKSEWKRRGRLPLLILQHWLVYEPRWAKTERAD